MSIALRLLTESQSFSRLLSDDSFIKKKKQKQKAELVVFNREDARVGSVAVSMAGHDAGLLMVIIAGFDADSVFVADGKRRKIDDPKKKKMQHLSIITKLEESDIAALREGTENDSFLRRKLSRIDLEGLT